MLSNVIPSIPDAPSVTPASVTPVSGGADELDQLTDALTKKFEEISLIHGLTERLRLDEDSSTICVALLEQLDSCISAETFAIDLIGDADSGFPPEVHQWGLELGASQLRALAEAAKAQCQRVTGEPFLEGVAITNHATAPAAQGKRVAVVLIERRGTSLGQMIAVRPGDQEEFGTVEVDLMKSTLMMLGMHLINQRQYLAMEQMFQGTVKSLVSALDAKDAYTCGHSTRVANLSVQLAGSLGYDEAQLSNLHMAGLLHDIGKIGVEDSVLRKPSRLTDDEFEQIKQHPILGYDILKGIRQFQSILPGVRNHHESWDGSGYPDGLAGDEIPRDAQILAVADSFDAMTSDRPYRKGMPFERVVDIFQEGRGTQWAADVVDALLHSGRIPSEFLNHASASETATA